MILKTTYLAKYTRKRTKYEYFSISDITQGYANTDKNIKR